MQYVQLGRAGIKVSRLCLGTMMFGGATGEAESIRVIHRALDAGINFVDTANIYNKGASEEITGKAIRDRRGGVVLATKVRQKVGDRVNDIGSSRIHILREIENSLRRLGTDVIDLYYLHAPDPATPVEESLRALEDCVRQGKVRYIACSNFRAWMLCEALWTSDRRNLASFAAVQPLYNLVNRDAEVELFPLCQAYGIGVVPYSPLARGVLTGKYEPGEPPPEGSRAARNDKRLGETELRGESFVVAQTLRSRAEAHGAKLSQWALAWVLANRIVTSAIIGPRTMEQLEDNLGCLALELTEDDEQAVDALVPPGEHTGKGYNDPLYPITGRPTRG